MVGMLDNFLIALTILKFFMNNVLFLLFLLPAFTLAQDKKALPTVSATPSVQKVQMHDNAGAFRFVEETWDFKEISQGIPVSHVYEYENSGKEPLIISQVTASCGCTTPEWTKEPVLPGKRGIVKVTYNAAKEGTFTKTVTILSNTGAPKYLTIKGDVVSNMDAPAHQ